jgi:xylulokinase
MKEVFLGLDIGSSSVKAATVDHDGTLFRSEQIDYDIKRPNKGVAELPVDAVFSAIVDVINSVVDSDVHVLSLTAASFGEAFVRLDRDRNPVGPIVMYTDNRGAEQASRLRTMIDPFETYRRNGCGISEMYSLPKIMWFRDAEPGRFETVERIIPVADYFLSRLGAEEHVSWSLAARTMAFDVTGNVWDREILRAAAISESLFPSPVPIGTAVGTISRESVSRTGLRPDTQIVAGGHDQIFAAIGAGLTEHDTVIDGLGSVECMTMIVPKTVDFRAMWANEYVRVPYLPDSEPVTYAYSLGGGEMFNWFARVIYGDTANGGDPLDAMFQEISDTSNGVNVLPHLHGAGTPWLDGRSTAVIRGIHGSVSRPDVVRAVIEGVNAEMMVNLERLRTCGFSPSRVVATGGGTRSSRVMQIKADMLALPVSISRHRDGGALGAAIVAATGYGSFPTIQAGMERWTDAAEPLKPSAISTDRYRSLIAEHELLYETSREFADVRSHKKTTEKD